MPSPIAVTMGDPFGVGIEICLKAWLQRLENNLPVFCVVGNIDLIQKTNEALKLDVPLTPVDDFQDATSLFHSSLPVLDPKTGYTAPEYTIAAIDKATELCLSGDASAMVTAPIQKKRLYDAGFQHPGHTEYLAEITGVPGREVMMMACSELKVVPATTHIPISAVPTAITAKLIEGIVRTTDKDLRLKFGIHAPRIVVSGLNPHAGEGGSIGTEDETVLRPLIQKLAGEGMNVTGPHSADTLFNKNAREKYDVAICMFHDQALIPIKTIDFDGGVNVTLGLPIIRTSPDHGTADDIAGQGIANPTSLITAITMAADMVQSTGNLHE